MESYKIPNTPSCDLVCAPCPTGTIRDQPLASGGCQEECSPCICPAAPKCAPPNCNNPLPSPVDDNGCVTGCPDCPPVPGVPACQEFACAQPNCEDPVIPPPDSDGCATGCPVCANDEEPTCNLVELCEPGENNCFRVPSCDDRDGDDKYVLVKYCDSSDCVISSESDIPLQPCNSEDCVAVESNELDYACPPPPYCTMDMLMCEGAFTPTDDQGCVTGCQQCPEENDISDTCRQLVDQYGLKIIQNLKQEVPATQVCGILDLCESSTDDLECAACEFIVNQAEAVISTNQTATEIVAGIRKECDLIGSTPSVPSPPCPPVPQCMPPRGGWGCDNYFIPTDESGCVIGCPICPPSPPREDQKAPNPPQAPRPVRTRRSPVLLRPVRTRRSPVLLRHHHLVILLLVH